MSIDHSKKIFATIVDPALLNSGLNFLLKPNNICRSIF